MEFKEFKKIPRLSREILVTEKIDGSNGQIVIMKSEDLREEMSNNDPWFDTYCLATKTLAEYSDLYMFAGSRNRWLTIGKNNDNHGFASWVKENAEQLFELGEGRHYGEWYGKGIQRGYGLEEKRWALFNVSKWAKKNFECTPPLTEKQKYCPDCCEVVPILYEGTFDTVKIDHVLNLLKVGGSVAVNHYMNPEGICIYHTAAGQYFKKTILNDQQPKGVTNG